MLDYAVGMICPATMQWIALDGLSMSKSKCLCGQRPGQDGGRVLYERVSQMSLEGGGDNGRGRKRGALAIQYVEHHTKPKDMVTKQGLPKLFSFDS